MRLSIILLFLCALVSEVFAQSDSIVVFTRESLFQVIDQNSTTIKVNSLLVADATENIRLSKNDYLPDINALWQVGYLGNGYLTDRDFSTGFGIHNPHFLNNISLEAAQTIYSGGALKGNVQMAELRATLANLNLQESRQQIRFLILSKLIELQCLNNQRNVIEQNIELGHQVLQQMQWRLDEGLLLENDRTRYELQIENLKLHRDRLDKSIAVENTSIATVLDYHDGTCFKLICDEIDENSPIWTLTEWNERAAQTNHSIQKANVGINLSETQLLIAKAERLPHISAFAYGKFNSPITIEVPILNKNFMFWGFGVNVSYSLSSLYKSGNKISKAKIGIIESRENLDLASQNVTIQIKEAYEAYMTAQSELRTLRYTLRLAEQNYDVVSSRFAEGMALVTDLVDAANVKIAAQNGIENAKSQLIFCLYRLKFISNTL